MRRLLFAMILKTLIIRREIVLISTTSILYLIGKLLKRERHFDEALFFGYRKVLFSLSANGNEVVVYSEKEGKKVL